MGGHSTSPTHAGGIVCGPSREEARAWRRSPPPTRRRPHPPPVPAGGGGHRRGAGQPPARPPVAPRRRPRSPMRTGTRRARLLTLFVSAVYEPCASVRGAAVVGMDQRKWRGGRGEGGVWPPQRRRAGWGWGGKRGSCGGGGHKDGRWGTGGVRRPAAAPAAAAATPPVRLVAAAAAPSRPVLEAPRSRLRRAPRSPLVRVRQWTAATAHHGRALVATRTEGGTQG